MARVILPLLSTLSIIIVNSNPNEYRWFGHILLVIIGDYLKEFPERPIKSSLMRRKG